MYINKLSGYAIPSKILLKLLKLNQYIGKKDYYDSLDTSSILRLKKESILDNANTIINYSNIDVSKDRIRLLLEKDSNPRTKKEEQVKSIKELLESIYEMSITNKSLINSIDLLDMVKILSNDKLKYSTSDFKLQNEHNSIRYYVNILFDELNEVFKNDTQEKLCTSVVTFMEFINLHPLDSESYIASVTLLYYLFGLCDISIIKFKSIFKYLLDNKNEIMELIQDGSVNYDEGNIYFNRLYEYFIDYLISEYDNLDKLIKSEEYLKHANKTDVLEKFIMEEANVIFSKEDIMNKFPNISSTTVTRCLISLRDKNFIIPLSTGRSAKWQRIVDSKDPLYFMGVNIKDEN